MGIFDSFKKNSNLSKISKILGKGMTQSDIEKSIRNSTNITSILADINADIKDDTGRQKRIAEREENEKALEDLIDLVENNENLKSIMTKYGADREKIKSLYQRLKSEGAGQWKGGHFVAASVFAFPQTLEYCLNSDKQGIRFGSVAGRCLMYFKNNETGAIE